MGKKVKILNIEDSEQDRKIFKRVLKDAGFEDIIFAERGEEGVEKVKNEKPDMVIIDTRLPGIDGFETCRQIRESCGPAAPKIIITTGFIDAVDAVKAREAGADDYCVKTADLTPCVDAVKKLV